MSILVHVNVSTPRTRRVAVITCAVLIAVGVVVLFVPGGREGSVLVPISEGHGLSIVDMIGAVLLAIGATGIEVLIVVRLPHLRLSPRALFGLGLVAGLGIGLILASVFTGFFWWWAVGAGLVGLALLVLVPRLT